MRNFRLPERFRMDELVQRYLKATEDPRKVVTDPEARYFGAELKEGTLVPEGGIQASVLSRACSRPRVIAPICASASSSSSCVLRSIRRSSAAKMPSRV